MMVLGEPHLIHHLAAQALEHRCNLFFPALDGGTVATALSIAGVGLDHLVGEQALGFQGDDDWHTFTLVTDRRVLGASASARYDVRFSAMLGVEVKRSLLDKRVFVQLPHARVCVANDAFSPELGDFLDYLTTVDPSMREPPPRPLCWPSEGDPCGVACALSWMDPPDDLSWQLLHFIREMFRRGEMSDATARDMVGRVVLHHRSSHYGRAMARGRWLSAVSADDVACAMTYLFGAPLGRSPQGGWWFSSGLRTDHSGAAVSTVAGLASVAIFGVGWVSRAHARVERFQLLAEDGLSATGFQLQAPDGRGLECDEPGLLEAIDAGLLNVERALLSRRVVFGWNDAPMALLARTDDEVAHAIHAASLGAP